MCRSLHGDNRASGIVSWRYIETISEHGFYYMEIHRDHKGSSFLLLGGSGDLISR